MKTYSQLLLCAVAGLLLIGSCQKDPLPKPTTEGKNTFGCKIDGRVWIPNGSSGLIPSIAPINGGFLRSKGSKHIFIRTYSKNGEEIHLYLEGIAEGTYLLNQTTNVIPGELSPKSYGSYNEGTYFSDSPFVTSSTATGKVVITRSDTLTGILSGTFEFVAQQKGNRKPITITEGRFDINQYRK